MRNTRNLLSEKVYSPTLDAALVVLATVLIVTLVYAPNAWAGAKFKTLYKFTRWQGRRFARCWADL
jgi:hypothetical protein